MRRLLPCFSNLHLFFLAVLNRTDPEFSDINVGSKPSGPGRMESAYLCKYQQCKRRCSSSYVAVDPPPRTSCHMLLLLWCFSNVVDGNIAIAYGGGSTGGFDVIL
jgi:hypothetical protein